MKGLNKFKHLSQLKLMIGRFNPRKHGEGYLLEKLNQHCAKLKGKELSDFIDIALRNQIVIQTLNPLFLNSNQYFLSEGREQRLPFKLILGGFAAFCEINAKGINHFYRLRKKLEALVLDADYLEALNAIEEIENNFGKSFWLVDIKMNVLHRLNNNSLLEDYVKQLNSDGISHISTLIYRKYKANSLKAYYRQVLSDLLLEYRSNDLGKYADFLSLLLVPEFIDQPISTTDFIIFSQRLSPIDRLVFTQKVLVNSMAGDYFNETLSRDILNFASRLSLVLEHQGWSNLVNFAQGNFKPRICTKTRSIIEEYSSGNYSEVIKLCKEYLDTKPVDLSILDIYVRSIIFANDEEEVESIGKFPNRLRNQILVTLIHVLDSVNNFELQTVTFENIFFFYLNFEFTVSIRPMFYAAYPVEGGDELRRASIELFCSEYQITPKYIRRLSDNDNSFYLADSLLSESKVTISRQLRFTLEEELRKGCASKSTVNELLNNLVAQDDVLESEYWCLWYRAKKETNQFESILKQVANKLIENYNNKHLFPLKEIASELERNRDLYVKKIDAVIVYYLYFRLQDFDSKESMSEFFEDFLSHHKVTLASELAENWKVLNSRQEFFLKEVCRPDVMSILITIDTNEQLLFERLKVLQTLNKLSSSNEDFILEEESKLYEQLYIDTLSIQHTTNKIDIDVDGIKKAKFREYETYFEIFSEFNNENPIDLINLFEHNEEEKLSKVDNAILHFYGRAYDSIVDDFIFSDDFGLVRFLSSEIRHGWLPNQIRSVLESFFLVTELGGEKQYENNSYWRKRLELTLKPEVIDKLDEELKWFSKQVDCLINEANSWPKATRELSNDERMFNLGYSIETLKKFKEYTKPAINGEHFFHLVTEFIWEQIEPCFVKMHSKINQVLKPRFNNLFDELNDRCTSLGVKLTQLHGTIQEARAKTIDEIDIIDGWFQRPKYTPIGDVYFQDALKVAIKNTRGIYNPRNIKFCVNSESVNFNVEQSKFLPLIRALSTAFQNCVKHGTKSADGSDITLKIQGGKDGYQLTVSNAITKAVYRKTIDNETVEKCQQHIKENRNELLVTEGGTGLYKVYRFIKDAFGETSFAVEVDENQFRQIIKLRL